MAFHFGFWDLMLLLGVSAQATAVAYLYQPKWKALVWVLPIPSTLATLALSRPVDATNALGMVLVFGFIQAVRLLYVRLRCPIVVSIVLSALGYCLGAWGLANIVPASEFAFWLAAALVLLLGLVLLRWLPQRQEPGQRTQLPVWLKLPIIAAVILALVLAKGLLRGFMAFFPMVGVIVAYEARRSLWTMGRQIPVMMVAVLGLLSVCRLVQSSLGVAAGLGLGWIAYLALLGPVTRLQAFWSRRGRVEPEPRSQAIQTNRATVGKG